MHETGNIRPTRTIIAVAHSDADENDTWVSVTDDREQKMTGANKRGPSRSSYTKKSKVKSSSPRKSRNAPQEKRRRGSWATA